MADVMWSPSRSPLSVLRRTNYLLYWLGQFISLTGTWMQVLAQSILILRLNDTAFALGLVNFASALPPALLLLYGGAVTDRLDKRRILLVTQVFFMVAAVVLALLVRSGGVRFWHVLALAAVLGVAQAFDLPANQALVPELVERDEIPSAVQLNQAIFHGSRVIGPPIASIVVAVSSLYVAFLVNAASFIPVIVTLLIIRTLRKPPARPTGSTLEQIGAGYAFVRSRAYLLAILGITAATTTLIFPNLAVLTVYYVEKVLGQGPKTLGMVMGVSGGGAFVGAMSLLFVPARRRVAHIGLGMLGICIGMAVMAAAPWLGGRVPVGSDGRIVLACVGATVLGLSVAHMMGLLATILQQSTPDELRGRVMSLYSLVFVGIMPFASLLMTKIADTITMPVEMLASTGLYAAAGFLLFRWLRTPEFRAALLAVEAAHRSFP